MSFVLLIVSDSLSCVSTKWIICSGGRGWTSFFQYIILPVPAPSFSGFCLFVLFLSQNSAISFYFYQLPPPRVFRFPPPLSPPPVDFLSPLLPGSHAPVPLNLGVVRSPLPSWCGQIQFNDFATGIMEGRRNRTCVQIDIHPQTDNTLHMRITSLTVTPGWEFVPYSFQTSFQINSACDKCRANLFLL